MSSKEIARGCGVRVPGAVYFVHEPRPGGDPVETFLFCPPKAIDPDAVGLAAVGVQLVRMGDTWHVLDRIGMRDYPNVADVVEEVRAIGLSRRASKALEFAKLTRDSRILLVHDRAIIVNRGAYYRAEPVEEGWVLRGFVKPCPRRHRHHKPLAAITDDAEMCGRLWWQDVRDPVAGEHAEGRAITREMPARDYPAYLKPERVEPEYAPAIFAAFPITGLQVIRSDTGEHERAAGLAGAAELPVSLEDF